MFKIKSNNCIIQYNFYKITIKNYDFYNLDNLNLVEELSSRPL